MINNDHDKKKTSLPCDDCDLKNLCSYMSMVREASCYMPQDNRIFIKCEYFKPVGYTERTFA